MGKKKIAIIFGGSSSEYGVSLQSAYGVISHIDKEKYETVNIGITREGEWFRYLGPEEKILEDLWHKDEKNLIATIISPDRNTRGIVEFRETGNQYTELDGAFPILHGKNGEDGTVQGLIELAGIPLIGCNTMSSALSMDKDKAHRIVESEGILVPKGIVINKYEIKEIFELTDGLNYPLFVKPLKEGSSYGITKVHERKNLLKAVEYALEYDKEVIIEENIEGFEVGCAILGNDNLIIGRVDEIELLSDFFDYEDKYTHRKSLIHMPARLDELMEDRIKEAAAIIYRALACSGFARVDMFLTPEREIVFNEVNTIPGFTSSSRYPSMMKGIGLSYGEVVNKLIGLGIRR